MNSHRSLTYLAHSLIGFTLAAFPCFASEGESAATTATTAGTVPPTSSTHAQVDLSSIVKINFKSTDYDDPFSIPYSPLYLPEGFQFVALVRGGKNQGEVVKVTDRGGTPHSVRVVPLKKPGRYSDWGDSEQIATYLGQVRREHEILQRFGGDNGIVALEGSYESPDKEYLYLLTTHHDYYFNNILYQKHLNEDHIKYLAQQLLSSFAHLHAQGIVHGSFSPHSIGINNNCETLVRDFGLETAHLGVGDYTMDFNLDEFKAPEQLLRQPNDPRADVWSLGLILARALLGPEFLAPAHRDVRHFLRSMVNTFGTAEAKEYAAGCETSNAQRFLLDTIAGVEGDNKPSAPLSALLADKGISAEGIAFISSLLRFDPRNRPTAQEALAHPWITSGYGGSEEKEETGDF